jgi:RNA polymerase sigma-70 factor (ECF subfamily)
MMSDMAVDEAQLEQHRTELTGHCYRMLGSPFDAEDAVQETMIRAWRGLERFDGRASLRTWLYRIATNVCIDSYSARARRIGPAEEGSAGSLSTPLEKRERTHWIEPIPDSLAVPDADPAQRASLRQSIRLAFVTALQHLPAKQRAALILSEVLGWSAAEIAENLETSVPSVNSAIQRARATLAAINLDHPSTPASATDTKLINQFVSAFEDYDVARLTALLSEDARLSMPPYTLWLQGRADIASWLVGPGAGCRGSRLVPLAASGSSAFGQYRQGGKEPWAVVVLSTRSDRITDLTYFLDTEKLFPLFNLPAQLPG